jgi:hypothetical protein
MYLFENPSTKTRKGWGENGKHNERKTVHIKKNLIEQ